MLSTLQIYLNPKQLLVEPFERLRFISLFVFLTLLAGLVSTHISSHLPISPLPPKPGPFSVVDNYRAVDASIFGAVFGTTLGASQWLILRKFIPDWRWIMATAVGFSGFRLIQQVWGNWSSNYYMSGQMSLMILLALPSLVITLLAAVCLGLLQWLILRYYVRPARWWVFIFPFVLLIKLVLLTSFSIFSLFNLQWPVTLDWGIFSFGVLGISQATGLCSLQRKVKNADQFASTEHNQRLAVAPEITSFRKLRVLSNRLYYQIHQPWKQEISAPADLVYLLGVTTGNKIIACLPANQLAASYISQTPLPTLVSCFSEDDVEQLSHQSLARFLVTFTVKGGLKIRSCRSYKLFWIIVGMLGLVALISTYPTWISLLGIA